MKGFDKLYVKSAVKDLNEIPINRTHLTTLDFGQIGVLFNEEFVPRDEIRLHGNYFARVAPLVKPTYGKILFKTASFFVDYHQIAEDSEAYFAGKKQWQGQTPLLRYFTAYDFFYLFNINSNGLISSVGASATNYDYVYVDSNGTKVYRLFTSKGRYWMKIFNQLGYMFPENVDIQSNSWWDLGGKDFVFSAYPLLAFFKAYNDWMSQSQRFNTSVLSTYLNHIRQNKSYNNYTNTGHLNNICLFNLFSELKLNYDNDYFTTAWQNPATPLTNTEGVSDISLPGSQNGYTAPANPKIYHDETNLHDNVLVIPDNTAQNLGSYVTARGLQFLKAFDDWVRRNNYSGSRDVQQIYSRFGIKTDDYRTHYAHVLSTSEDVLNVGDVTATAESTNVPLGDYAGKGIVSCENNVDYKSTDYGLFIVLGYVTVKPMMSFGCDRKVLRNKPLDWYNPEFDGTGAEAISYREVFESCKIDPSTMAAGINPDSVFGFTERYNSYRFSRDQITGDFKFFEDMDVWHTGRDLSGLVASGNLIAQSSSMNTLPQTDSEYNRIFSVQSGDVDHFYFTCQFDVEMRRPMLSLNQVPNLGEGNVEVPRNGNVIN